MIITFKKPTQIDGKEIKSITLDFDSMKGRKLIAAEKEARLRGNTLLNPLHASLEGQAIVAAQASGWKVEDIEDLDGPDFMEVTGQVSLFLNGLALPEITPSETSEKQS
ncbi:phage tail assembly protein [Brevibacillus brevis]|uniref:phage tail assembly protein n=1 Tax=Brevibacillus brevis TaxID=1393 RepID=UPI001C8D3F4A|nr:phage tail assembly protein [Brevibacillus brevis]MBY0088393.1 phage tail assembly protein [Brevibacillus brevis]